MSEEGQRRLFWMAEAKIDALTALLDHLEASLATATTTRHRLLEALLHEALAPAEDRAAAA